MDIDPAQLMVILVVFLILVAIFSRTAASGRCLQCRKRVNKHATVCPYCGNQFAE